MQMKWVLRGILNSCIFLNGVEDSKQMKQHLPDINTKTQYDTEDYVPKGVQYRL